VEDFVQALLYRRSGRPDCLLRRETWHRELLHSMALPVADVRDRVLVEETLGALDELRRVTIQVHPPSPERLQVPRDSLAGRCFCEYKAQTFVER